MTVYSCYDERFVWGYIMFHHMVDYFLMTACPFMSYPLLIPFLTYSLSASLLMPYHEHFWCLISIPSAFDSSHYLLEQIRWMIIRLDDIMNLWIKNWRRFHACNKETRWKKRDKVRHNEIWALCETKLTVNAKEHWGETRAKPSSHLSQSGWEIVQGKMILWGGVFLSLVFYEEGEVRLNVTNEQMRYEATPNRGIKHFRKEMNETSMLDSDIQQLQPFIHYIWKVHMKFHSGIHYLTFRLVCIGF